MNYKCLLRSDFVIHTGNIGESPDVPLHYREAWGLSETNMIHLNANNNLFSVGFGKSYKWLQSRD